MVVVDPVHDIACISLPKKDYARKKKEEKNSDIYVLRLRVECLSLNIFMIEPVKRFNEKYF